MIIWIRGGAIGMPCDQRASLQRVEGGNLHVTLEGTEEPAIVSPDEVCGLEFEPLAIGIRFTVHSVYQQSVQSPHHRETTPGVIDTDYDIT